METMVLCPDLLTLRPSSLPGQHLSVWTRSYFLVLFDVVLLLEEYQTQSSELLGCKTGGLDYRGDLNRGEERLKV